MKFKSITVCLDMLGCPNRCRHCWLGHSPNGKLTMDDLRYTAEQFRPFTDSLTVYDWYREPNFGNNYREMWKTVNELSDTRQEHFELISVWRIVRDPDYAEWLSEIGLKTAQLTVFGGQENTDYFTGRKNAYNDILAAIGILLKHRISPRIQYFLNSRTADDLPLIEKLITDMQLEQRCRDIGGEFVFFTHQGSCVGENEKLYDIRPTSADLEKIPPKLAEYTLKHFGADDLHKVFGRTEHELYNELINDCSTENYVRADPLFFVDGRFDVYPNISAPEIIWRLGNLKTDGAQKIISGYVENKSPAQHTRLTVPICEMVKSEGNPDSLKLFSKGDYIEFILNRYTRKQA